MIDWNVRFGDLLVIVSLAGTGIMYAFKSGRFTESIRNMQLEIVALKKFTEAVTGLLTTIAEQKKDIEYIRNDIYELKRGRGWIQGEGGVNGEYPKR